LALFGSPTLYAPEALETDNVDTLTLVTPWHPAVFQSKNFSQTWGGPVTWRTAMAYDATIVIIEALRGTIDKGIIDRINLQKTISDPRFEVKDGALGQISFDSQGNRKGKGYIIKAAYNSNTALKYEFVLIKP
jgi:branched-chain amino acid transport system substrate-binding protein